MEDFVAKPMVVVASGEVVAEEPHNAPAQNDPAPVAPPAAPAAPAAQQQPGCFCACLRRAITPPAMPQRSWAQEKARLTLKSGLWLLLEPWWLMFRTVLPDLACLRWYEALAAAVFGALCITFNILDMNYYVDRNSRPTGNKYTNDTIYFGIEEWRARLMLLSGAASFSGAACVVLTNKGLFSSYFWGFINVITLGLFCRAYGYYGDMQLNLIFFLLLMVYGLYAWCYSFVSSTEVAVRALSLRQWALALAGTLGLGFAFYWEIPQFAKHLDGIYFYEAAPVPHRLDAANTAISVVAQVLLNMRAREQWLWWMTANCLQLAMFSGQNGFPPDANLLLMLSLYLANSLLGALRWHRMYKRQAAAAAAGQKQQPSGAAGSKGSSEAASGAEMAAVVAIAASSASISTAI